MTSAESSPSLPRVPTGRLALDEQGKAGAINCLELACALLVHPVWKSPERALEGPGVMLGGFFSRLIKVPAILPGLFLGLLRGLLFYASLGTVTPEGAWVTPDIATGGDVAVVALACVINVLLVGYLINFIIIDMQDARRGRLLEKHLNDLLGPGYCLLPDRPPLTLDIFNAANLRSWSVLRARWTRTPNCRCP